MKVISNIMDNSQTVVHLNIGMNRPSTLALTRPFANMLLSERMQTNFKHTQIPSQGYLQYVFVGGKADKIKTDRNILRTFTAQYK